METETKPSGRHYQYRSPLVEIPISERNLPTVDRHYNFLLPKQQADDLRSYMPGSASPEECTQDNFFIGFLKRLTGLPETAIIKITEFNIWHRLKNNSTGLSIDCIVTDDKETLDEYDKREISSIPHRVTVLTTKKTNE